MSTDIEIPVVEVDKRIQEICDRMLADPFWAYIARYWIKYDDEKRRQAACYGVASMAVGVGLSQQEAQAFQRGFTIGLAAAMDIYRPKGDA